jgi:hypothetical protein
MKLINPCPSGFEIEVTMNVRKFSQLAIGLFLGLVLAGAVGSVWSLVSDKFRFGRGFRV